MRYLPFTLWAAITVVLIAMAISDFLFGKSSPRRAGLAILLSLVWPIAILSRAGRELLLNVGRKL